MRTHYTNDQSADLFRSFQAKQRERHTAKRADLRAKRSSPRDEL